jgi:hypothetical protein
MLWPIEKLRAKVARRLELFESGIITDSELSTFVLYECAFALLDRPDDWPQVDGALAMIPLLVLRSVESEIVGKQLGEGIWEWPPVGAIGGESTTVFRTADLAEANVMERLKKLISERVGKT